MVLLYHMIHLNILTTNPLLECKDTMLFQSAQIETNTLFVLPIALRICMKNPCKLVLDDASVKILLYLIFLDWNASTIAIPVCPD